MSPSFGYGRGGKVYRYYVSAPLQAGHKHKLDRDKAIRRVTAESIHEIVSGAVGPRLAGKGDGIEAAVGAIRRVEILPDEVRLNLIADCLTPAGRKGLPLQGEDLVLTVPMRCQPRGGRVEHVLPPGAKRNRVKRDPTLIEDCRRLTSSPRRWAGARATAIWLSLPPSSRTRPTTESWCA